MSQKSSAPAAVAAGSAKPAAERVVRDIRRRTRKHHSAEEKIRIVLEGLRGEDEIDALVCNRALLGRGGEITHLRVWGRGVDLGLRGVGGEYFVKMVRETDGGLPIAGADVEGETVTGRKGGEPGKDLGRIARSVAAVQLDVA